MTQAISRDNINSINFAQIAALQAPTSGQKPAEKASEYEVPSKGKSPMNMEEKAIVQSANQANELYQDPSELDMHPRENEYISAQLPSEYESPESLYTDMKANGNNGEPIYHELANAREGQPAESDYADMSGGSSIYEEIGNKAGDYESAQSIYTDMSGGSAIYEEIGNKAGDYETAQSIYTDMSGGSSIYEEIGNKAGDYESAQSIYTDMSANGNNGEPIYQELANAHEGVAQGTIYEDMSANGNNDEPIYQELANAYEGVAQGTIYEDMNQEIYTTMRAGGDSTYSTMKAGGDSTYSTMRAGAESLYSTIGASKSQITDDRQSIFELMHQVSNDPTQPKDAQAGRFSLLPPPPPPSKSLTSITQLKEDLSQLTNHYRDNDKAGIRGLFHKSPLHQLTGAMRDYQKALKEYQVNNKGDVDRFAQATKLFEKLDKISDKLSKYGDFLAQKTNNDPQVGEYINEMHESLDDQRLALARVLNNQNLAQKSPDTMETNQQTKPTNFYNALELKIHGYEYNQAIEVASDPSKVMGSKLSGGKASDVYDLQDMSGNHVVFKREQGEVNVHISVNNMLDVPDRHPQFGGRNIATSNIDKALGGNVIVNTKFMQADFGDEMGKIHHNIGIAMDKVKGDNWFKLPVATIKNMVNDPNYRRDIMNLQLMDAITLQLDRHEKNFLIETNDNGEYKGLKGIDNDNGFDSIDNQVDISQLHTNQTKSEEFRGSHNAGLPPLMDKDMALKCANRDNLRAIIQQGSHGLINPKNIASALARADKIADHAQKLLNEGRVVSNWQSGKADNGQKIADIVKNPGNESSYMGRMLDKVPALKSYMR